MVDIILLVGIISDIHANLASLKKALKICDEYSIDKILCAGDIIGYYTEPVEVLDLIRQRTDDIVIGNHDAIAVTDNFKSEIRYFNDIARQSLVWTRDLLKNHKEEWNFIKNLPYTKNIDIDGLKFFMVHSTPHNPEDWDYFYYFGVYDQDQELTSWLDTYDADVMIMGHTHVPFIFQTDEENKRTVLNPGSTGQPRDGDKRGSLMFFDTQERQVQHVRYEYDIKSVCREVAKHKLHHYLCKRLSRGR